MRRAPLVLLGTAAGIVGVLAFPVRNGEHLTVAGVGTSGATGAPPASAGPTSTAGSSTAGSSAQSSTAQSSASGTRSVTGADEAYQFGDLAVTVTVAGSKITNVGMAALNVPDGRSASIDNYAIPQLEQEVVSADSANVNAVSGATFTSQAFAESVTSALQKLGIG